MAEAVGCRVIWLHMPTKLACFALDHIPGVRSLMRIPSSTLTYLTHPTHYLTDDQVDLTGTGVSCPTVRSYMPAIFDFMHRNPQITPEAMR